MDPLSVTASIIAIMQMTFKVSESLSDAKDASNDRSQFATEISNLSKLLVDLLSRLDESSDHPWHASVRALGDKDGPIFQYRVALEKLKDKISAGDGLKKITRTLLWTYIKEDAESILTRIERLKSLVHIALANDHLKLSQAIDSRIDSLQNDNKVMIARIDAAHQDKDREKHRRIMDWLSSDDSAGQNADILSRRQPDTGLWFLKSSNFIEWAHGTNKTLFCPGIPGAGKTMMAAITVDHLHSVMQTADVGVTCFYFDYKRQTDQTIPNLLAAILKQLVQDQQSISPALSSLYDEHQMRGTRPSLQEILDTLRSVLGDYSQVYVVIDALDECQERNDVRHQLLRVCRDLQKQFNLHLMVTSRHISDIMEEFKDVSQLEVRASSADVRRYVAGKIEQLPRCIRQDSDLQETIQNKVCEAVDGMFLLARLHVDSLLDKRTRSKVIYALNNLSKGQTALDDAYGKAIDRIEGQLPEDRLLAKNVLSWISCAQRPLTTGELCHALAVKMGDTDIDLENILEVEDILSVCAGLVTVDEESRVIRLVHYTTQDYLEGIRENWNPDCQYEIASTCLTYLCFEPFRQGSCLSNAEFESRLAEYEFLFYSAQHWHEHVATVQVRVSTLAMLLLQNSELIASVYQARRRYQYEFDWYGQRRQVTGLHLAASFGLLHLLQELLIWSEEKKVIVADSRDGRDQTPLMWAIRHSQKDAVELLLLGTSNSDVDVNAEDRKEWTPLMWAVRGGDKNIIKLLLDTRKAEVDVNAKDSNDWTPLMWAVREGDEDVVKLLLDTGRADVDVEDADGWTPLKWAVLQGDKSIVKLLMDTKKAEVDVNAKDIRNWAPLIWAVREGNKDAVKLMLDIGRPDLEAKDRKGKTALMYAAREGRKDIVETLLGTGRADVEAKNLSDITALMYAAREGRKDIVEILLGTGKADVEAKDMCGKTALMYAAHKGRKDIVETLLGTGRADVEAKNLSGKTALMYAALIWRKDISEILLDTGKADVEAKDLCGKTALMYAAHKGRKDVVKTLLGTGRADVEAKNGKGETALMYAAREGRKGIVEILLGTGGADIEAKNGKGETALDLAKRRKHEDIVLLLQAHLQKS